MENHSKNKGFIMESPAFFFTFFLGFLLLSATGYSVYVSFGPPSKKLRDPFEEHED
jgi:PsbN protein